MGWFRRRPWLTVLLTVAYVALLALTLGYPYPIEGERGTRFVLVLDAMGSIGIASRYTYILIEFTSNMLLFLPMGMLGWWLSGRVLRPAWARVAVTLVLGIAVSATAEFLQGRYLPERTSDLRDIVSNGIGVLVGCAVAFAMDRAEARRARAEADRS
ncbi:VanZ family protein [Agromyces rhizosphaerae]|uniref:VanZ family protein n=1 Tax=Agromyces rhizosphaerae TaxID=88374 RepID=UPI00248FCB41|nr:VanZ family protein [Agromyces rhizosphaerae]